jgi:hypothetical protein
MADRQALNIEILEHQHRGLSVQLEAIMRHAHLTPLEEQRLASSKRRSSTQRIASPPCSA